MEKVVVGISGGVDSAVVAYILKKEGYDVYGVTLNIWQEDNELNATAAIEDAKKVCEKLEIHHIILDCKKVFKEKIIDNFAQKYIDGKTPNPCLGCNRHIKFQLLIDYADSIGAKYIATGHYANILKNNENDRLYVARALNDIKDQSYVLYMLTQEQLSRTLMPLGKYTKDEVRNIARENGLIVADKKDSQEICFVKDNDYVKYICDNYNYKPKSGNFVDLHGNVYGKHKGIISYTICQRRGLGLSFKQPMYVVKLSKDKNEVVLGEEKDLMQTTLTCTDVNYMAIEKLDKPLNVMAKIRYNSKMVSSTIYSTKEGKIKVDFMLPVRGVAPGQAAVFYIDDKLICGGEIE